MLGFLGAIGLSLSMDKSTYKVGESPIYRITGAIPGATIAWSSTKNGQQTGEYQSSYGAKVDANGTAEMTGGAFTDADKGQWTKTAMILRDDGKYDLSNVAAFSVIASQPTTGGNTPPVPSGHQGNFFDDAVDYLKENPVIAIGAAVGAYFLFSGRGRR